MKRVYMDYVRGKTIPRWDLFEVAIHCTKNFANPFVDVPLEAEFLQGSHCMKVRGFFDGEGIWRIRFMPLEEGLWSFRTLSPVKELDGLEGDFLSTPPTSHGPVKVNHTHFTYADGTPFFVCGTTAYAWTYRPEYVRAETLRSFERYRFNKVRMLFFPKYLAWLKEVQLTYEPPSLPFEQKGGTMDFSRYGLDYFRNFETCIKDLNARGIEADVILFHRYDFGRWGIDTGLDDDRACAFLDYLVARIGAFRNVWWSLANEYDLWITEDGVEAVSKPDQRDWDKLGEYLSSIDPYGHPISIHNWGPIYPDRPWLSHVSYQNANVYSLLIELKHKYRKPVINDEYQYEGNLPYAWGNLSWEETTIRHWLTAMAGGYGTHGECYTFEGNNRDIFWTYGGTIRGGSASRIMFMREIIESLPFQEMEPDHTLGDGRTKFCLRKGYECYLFLFLPGSSNRRVRIGPLDSRRFNYQLTVWDAFECRKVKQIEVQTLYKADADPGLVAVTAIRKG